MSVITLECSVISSRPAPMLPEILLGAPQKLAEVLARRLEDAGRAAIAARGRFALALPGGTTAQTLLPRLAVAELDWARTDCFWSDERAVPPADPESNFGLARGLLLDPAGVPAASIHRMVGEAPDLQAAADAYRSEMTRVLGPTPSLDVVLIGMGPDGHICSLFPGHALLRERSRWVAVIEDSPKPPPRRLTFTMPALAAAALVIVAAFGEAKAGAVREALEDPESQLPVSLVARSGPRIVFLLDPAAASRLERPPQPTA